MRTHVPCENPPCPTLPCAALLKVFGLYSNVIMVDCTDEAGSKVFRCIPYCNSWFLAMVVEVEGLGFGA